MYSVVVAEDEHWIRRGIVEMVNRTGGIFQVAGEAENGDEAWRLIRERCPSMLITDIEMPQKDGLSLVKNIDDAKLPVVSIIVSGYDRFEYAQQGARYGISEYLLKPVMQESLLEALERSVYRLELLHPVHEQMALIRSFLDNLTGMDVYQVHKELALLMQAILKTPRIHRGSKLALLRIFAGRWRALMESYFDGYAQPPASPGEETEETLAQQLRQLAEDWSRYTRKQDQSRSFRLVIKQACELAQQAYMKEISLADAAGHTGLSVSHFSALFKQHTGDSYVSYVNRIRIDKAKQLLLEPDLKIYQVAEIVGFVSVPYFTRIFKAVAGQSPNAYRKGLGI